jgi:MurNAc alpha-1-phosphate uridylyltransferase
MAPNGKLTQRGEGHVAPFVYSGFGIVKPDLFAGETRDVFRLAPTFFEAAARGRLHGVRLDGLWLHVGTPEAISEAEAAIARSQR